MSVFVLNETAPTTNYTLSHDDDLPITKKLGCRRIGDIEGCDRAIGRKIDPVTFDLQSGRIVGVRRIGDKDRTGPESRSGFGRDSRREHGQEEHETSDATIHSGESFQNLMGYAMTRWVRDQVGNRCDSNFPHGEESAD